MTDPATGQVRALADLLALAAVREEMAAERYEALGRTMRARGNEAVAVLFEDLAREEHRHCRAVHDMAGGAITDVARDRWRSHFAGEQEDTDNLPHSPTAYQALAHAVRSEEHAFRRYSYIAAQADDPAIVEVAEALAQEELAHAALLRRARRHAFHEERASAGGRLADKTIPLSHEALCGAALKQEQNLLRLFDSVDRPEGSLQRQRSITAGLVEQLKETAKTLGLAETAGSVEPIEQEDIGGPLSGHPALHIALDRAFELYDRVVERTDNEDALDLAQALSAATAERLKLLSNTQDGGPTPG